MRIYPFVFFSLFPFFAHIAKAETVFLSESFLIEQVFASSPDLEAIRGDYAQSLVDYRRVLDDYRFSLEGSADYTHSNERALSPFSPVASDVRSYSVGVRRPTRYGLDVGVFYTGNQTTTNALADATQNQVTANVVLDLYKNFLGRLNRAEIQEAEFNQEAARLLKKVNTDRLVLELRNLYWDYVGANESYKVSERLLKSAEEQVEDIKKRRRGGIADEGDVARFSSQRSERKAQVLQFQANKKVVELNFRQLLPTLNGKTIDLAPYDLNFTVDQFYACLDLIAQQKQTPFEFSLLDDIIELLEREYEAQQKITQAINRPNLSLTTEAGLDGKGFQFSQSNNRLNDPGDEFYSLGLRLDVPLDRKLSRTETTQAELDRHRFQAEVLRLKSEMSAFHETLVEAVGLLRDVVVNRLENTQHLDIAVKDSRKKYRQARITSQQLIDEEDRFLTNELNLIDVEVQIIQVMFDYFALFTETPCELNRVVP